MCWAPHIESLTVPVSVWLDWSPRRHKIPVDDTEIPRYTIKLPLDLLEIIDDLEPNTRGPYSGALGYLGFNRESQLSILIRAAIRKGRTAYFHAGAGIVADSVPAAEPEWLLR